MCRGVEEQVWERLLGDLLGLEGFVAHQLQQTVSRFRIADRGAQALLL